MIKKLLKVPTKDLEKIKQTQAIIAQAIANEQILSQQKLQNIVAYTAVYNPTNSIPAINQKQITFLDSVINYINLLLNKTILALHNAQKTKTKKPTPQFPLYTPRYKNTNPCEQPTIYKQKNLHLCPTTN